MRFESKRDLWLVVLMRGLPVLALAVIVAATRDYRGAIAGAIILLIVELFFFETLLRGTYYIVEAPALIIRSSIFQWRVPINEIRAVTPTRSPLSSPALSLDRLRIDYGTRAIMVSPDDPRRFIEALRAINPSIVA